MLLNGHQTDVDTLRDLVRARAHPGAKTLLVVDDQELTYSEADHRANALANALHDLGVTKGDVTATYLYNCVDHFILWMACVKLGGVWAPLNISLVGADLRQAIASCTPFAVVVDDGLFVNYESAQVPTTAMRILCGAGRGENPEWLHSQTSSRTPMPVSQRSLSPVPTRWR